MRALFMTVYVALGCFCMAVLGLVLAAIVGFSPWLGIAGGIGFVLLAWKAGSEEPSAG